MQVLVMHDDVDVQIAASKRLMSKGFQVIGLETVARACDYVKRDPVDILLLGDRVGGRLSHSVALAAECANPMVTTMILTERRDTEIDELYELLPSLYALISPKVEASTIAQLALTAVANPEESEARMRRNATARQVQPMADWASVFLNVEEVACTDQPSRDAKVEIADTLGAEVQGSVDELEEIAALSASGALESGQGVEFDQDVSPYVDQPKEPKASQPVAFEEVYATTEFETEADITGPGPDPVGRELEAISELSDEIAAIGKLFGTVMHGTDEMSDTGAPFDTGAPSETDVLEDAPVAQAAETTPFSDLMIQPVQSEADAVGADWAAPSVLALSSVPDRPRSRLHLA